MAIKVDRAKLLKNFGNEYAGREYEIVLDCPEFSSLCPYSGNPDYGRLVVSYVPGKKCIETKSLKLYLLSYRSERIFNEHAVNRICDDLAAACKPVRLRVDGHFNTRGGISIHVSAEYPRK